MAIGFVIDGSGSVDAAEMKAMKDEIADFIQQIASNNDPNPSIFYANLFGTALRDDTGAGGFRDDVGKAVSDKVRGFQSDFGNQVANVATGLDDMASEFAKITDPVYSAIAYVFLDGPANDSPAVLAAAAQNLKDSTIANLNFPVTVIGVPIGNGVPAAQIEEIATKNSLVIGAPAFNFLALPLEDGILAVDTDADGELDCDDGCPTDPEKTEPGVDGCLVPANACKGSFGFVIDSSTSFGQANFDDAIVEIANFIAINSEFSSLGVANGNEYYAVSYTTAVEDRTNLFSRNAFGGVADRISNDFPYIGGAKDTSVGLRDLRERFLFQDDDGLPSDARFAFIITDGMGDDIGAVRAAANLLKQRGQVVLIVLPPEGAYDAAIVEEIASEDQNGDKLVMPIADYKKLEKAMMEIIKDIDLDEDGAKDCVDSCPMDANKLDAGLCGCGKPEVAGC